MIFVPPATVKDDGGEGYTVLAFEQEGGPFEVGPPMGTILVEHSDHHGTEWIVWTVRLTDGLCAQGTYMHTMAGYDLQQATAKYDERVKRRRAR